jgi:hypothetical protein
MTDALFRVGNPAKNYEELTPEQKEQALGMFASQHPHVDYFYEIDGNGNIRCRRYNAALKSSRELLA